MGQGYDHMLATVIEKQQLSKESWNYDRKNEKKTKPKGAFSPLILNLLLEDESVELSDEKMLLLNIWTN